MCWVVIPGFTLPLAAFSTGNLSNGTVAGPAAVNSNGSSPGYMGGGRSLTFGGSDAAAGLARNGSGHHSTSTFQEVVSKAISVDEKLSASRCEEKKSVALAVSQFIFLPILYW